MSLRSTIDNIKDELGNSGKRALIVEGKDDIHALDCFLGKLSKNWSNTWRIECAGSKENVLKIIEGESNWIGVVDRDEWQQITVDEKQQKHANLFVLPRFCIENYIIEPEVLWKAIPSAKRDKVGNEFTKFASEIDKHKDLACKHGLLWQVVNPLWRGIRARGFVNTLLDVEYTAIEDDAFLVEKLKEWHDFLNPNMIIAKYRERLLQLQNADDPYRYRQIIHGKRFFERVVYPTLVTYFGQQKMPVLQNNLFKGLPVEAFEDLYPLAELMGLYRQ